MSDFRKFFVITLRGEVGPFTVEDLHEEVQAQRIARTDRLRTAFGANAGTVGEAIGASPRSNRTPHRLASVGGPGNGEGKTGGGSRAAGSDRLARSRGNSERRSAISSTARFPWLFVAIGGGVVVFTGATFLIGHPRPVPTPVATTTAPTPSTPAPMPAKPAVVSIQNPGSLPATTLPQPSSLPYENLPQQIPGIIQIWRFDEGGQGVGYEDQDEVNYGNFTVRANTGVDLLQNNGKIHVGYVTDGEWLAFTCQVTTAGRYRWSLTASRDQKLYPDPKPVGLFWTLNGRTLGLPVIISDTGSFSKFQKFAGEVDLDVGRQVLHLNADGAGMAYRDITFSPISTSPPGAH